MHSKNHWEKVYTTKPSDSLSWYQAQAETSLKLIRETGIARSAAIIDVGAGASTLVDDLLAEGYDDVTLLDLSAAALGESKKRLGERAASVEWIEANVVDAVLPEQGYAVWHDRAVFHFLTDPHERQAYVQAATRALKPGGHLLVATFAEDGPAQCSGLAVARYSAEGLAVEFAPGFALVRSQRETHRTPGGAMQSFVYCYCRKISP